MQGNWREVAVDELQVGGSQWTPSGNGQVVMTGVMARR